MRVHCGAVARDVYSLVSIHMCMHIYSCVVVYSHVNSYHVFIYDRTLVFACEYSQVYTYVCMTKCTCVFGTARNEDKWLYYAYLCNGY